ncbi:MAG: 3'-5' exonuclease, partial [Rhabdochlamydiaceae bacterium]
VVNLIADFYWKEKIFAEPSNSDAFDLDIVDSFSPKTWPKEVELWAISPQELKRDSSAHGIAVNIAKMIENGEKASDIAVLVNSWRQGVLIRDQLKRRGIESQMMGGRNGLFTRLEARDLANVLTSLADPLDDFSLIATLRGPLVNLSFDSIAELSLLRPINASIFSFTASVESDQSKLDSFLSWYRPLSQIADQLSAWEVISQIFADGKMLEAMARRPRGLEMVANLRKLARLATEQPDLGPMEFAASIREIQKIKHDITDAATVDDDADAVIITTIHKAKGLEFPVVVLGEPSSSSFSDDSEIKLEAKSGMVCVISPGERVPVAGLIEAMEAHRYREEGLRLLYVALTRAKRRLCLPLCSKASREGPAKWLAKVPAIKAELERIEAESIPNESAIRR